MQPACNANSTPRCETNQVGPSGQGFQALRLEWGFGMSADHDKSDLRNYIASHSSPPDGLLQELSAETAARYPQQADMQIDPVRGRLLTIFARATKARLAIEIGTFTGYSSVCIARGLMPGGKLICCDINEEWTSVARKYWEKDGVDGRIDLRLGPGLDTIGSFPCEPMFDLAFVDADRDSYLSYWLELVPRMRPGGLLLVDDAFWGGEVVAFARDGRVMYVREFSDLAAADLRVDLALTAITDGLLVACRKADDGEPLAAFLVTERAVVLTAANPYRSPWSSSTAAS
jgi:caffeoyl-CoA O-methyltransferase